MEELRARLRKHRPARTICLELPEDVVDELEEVAALLGFSGYQPLIRAYIGQGLRQDLERPTPLEKEQRRLAAFDRIRGLLERPSVTIGGRLPSRDEPHES